MTGIRSYAWAALLVTLSVSGCATHREPVWADPADSASHSRASGNPDDTQLSSSPESTSTSLITLSSHSDDVNEADMDGTVDPFDLAVAPGATGDGLTIVDVEAMALANNPAIRQASAAAQKLASVQHQVGQRPNPTVGYFANQLADQGTDQQGLFVEQEFVRGGKLELNQRVLNQATQAQMWHVETQRQRVLTDVRMRFYEALAAQRRTMLTYEFLDVVERGVNFADQRLAAGEGTRIDVLQTQVQQNEVDLLRRQAEFAFLGAWRELVAIAGVPSLEPQVLVDELEFVADPIDPELAFQQIASASPELGAARARVAEARTLIDRQQVQAVPNLTLQFGAGVDNATGSGLINLQLGAPIPVFNDNEGNISAAHAEYCRATHEVQRIEMGIKSRLARAIQEYESARAAVETFEGQILPQAKESLSLSEEAYSGGQLNFLQVLIVRRTFFESNLKYVESLSNLAQASTRIDGLLLTGGLDAPSEIQRDDSLRGQTFSGQ